LNSPVLTCESPDEPVAEILATGFVIVGDIPTRRSASVGVIDDASWFKPLADVCVSRKLPSTVRDEDAKVFDKMPG